MKRKQSSRKQSARKSAPPRQDEKSLNTLRTNAPRTSLPCSPAGQRALKSPRGAENREPTRVVAQVDLHTDSNFFSGFSGDLSDGGLFVSTYLQLAPGQPVEVELSLPGGQYFSAQGRVAWLREPAAIAVDLAPGAGIVFDELDPQARKLAETFMLFREPTFVDSN